MLINGPRGPEYDGDNSRSLGQGHGVFGSIGQGAPEDESGPDDQDRFVK